MGEGALFPANKIPYMYCNDMFVGLYDNNKLPKDFIGLYENKKLIAKGAPIEFRFNTDANDSSDNDM